MGHMPVDFDRIKMMSVYDLILKVENEASKIACTHFCLE